MRNRDSSAPVDCPTCDAKAGEPCRRPAGDMVPVHGARAALLVDENGETIAPRITCCDSAIATGGAYHGPACRVVRTVV